ncbi:LacI family DNA-binding transcriptional regulator [Flagellimonas myxillae]|uniref:LacI family DNA-binding transcriptional regulator n=1 Tax=Flagellimonas myxillae TaxID=2942214 RepID=UPI00201FA09D|nr:LacI family DNA-binding transcriptional regulator [Muricauda myxillae]MCL6264865.1 LacI family DNA-binding transcriptional regulator [Muricauda myxillae]
MKRITIKEIAKKAGVSIGTVDRVLHNRGEVASKTKELVLKIAKEGKYTTNVYARSLKLNKLYRIGILLPKDNEYWRILNHAINETAERYASLGIHPDFFTFDRHSETSFQQQVEHLLKSEPDGVILAPLIENRVLTLTQQLDKIEVPYVFVDSDLDKATPIAFIGQNSYQAGYLAARLLNYGIHDGQRAYIARFFDFDSLNKTIEERIEGFKDFYKTNNSGVNRVIEVDLSNGFYEFLDELKNLETTTSPCIFIPNSRAHQLVEQLKTMNVQLRTLGFDLINENRKALREGTLDFIIDQNPGKQGSLALQAFYDKLIANTKVEAKQLMALEIFTKENLLDN